MTDLRAAVEGLPNEYMGLGRRGVDRAAVLALIPEGAVLVTEDGLAEATYTLGMNMRNSDGKWLNDDEFAAAVFRHLRETP